MLHFSQILLLKYLILGSFRFLSFFPSVDPPRLWPCGSCQRRWDHEKCILVPATPTDALTPKSPNYPRGREGVVEWRALSPPNPRSNTNPPEWPDFYPKSSATNFLKENDLVATWEDSESEGATNMSDNTSESETSIPDIDVGFMQDLENIPPSPASDISPSQALEDGSGSIISNEASRNLPLDERIGTYIENSASITGTTPTSSIPVVSCTPAWKCLIGQDLPPDKFISLIEDIFTNKDEVKVICDLLEDDAQTFINTIHEVRLLFFPSKAKSDNIPSLRLLHCPTFNLHSPGSEFP